MRAWQAAYRGLLADEELDRLSMNARAERWRRLLVTSAATSFTLISEERDEVVGFCSVVAPARDEDLGQATWELAAMYVFPRRWRSGLGSALLDEAARRLDDGPWDEGSLWVFRDNRRALAFYAKHGFTADGTLRRRDEQHPPEIRLRRPFCGR